MTTATTAPAGVARLEGPEIAGFRDLWSAAPADLAATFGIAHRDVGGAHCGSVAALGGMRLLNHAVGLPADRPVSEADLRAVEDHFAAQGVSAHVALAEGSPAGAQLAARGYRRARAWVKFVRDTAPPAPVACDLEVREIPRADAGRMGEILAAAFDLPAGIAPWLGAVVGRPGWRCLGAYDGPALVATGSLFLGGGGGWVTLGATDAAQRGRRAQKALLAARIALAGELGLARVVVETGERAPGRPDPSYRNILAAGFRPAYRRPFWCAELSPPDPPGRGGTARRGGAPSR